MLHVVHLGVAQHLVASLLSEHYESLFGPSLTLRQLERLLATDAWSHYRSWCKQKGPHVATCSLQFNLARLNRESWLNYPELQGYKGAVVKYMLYWVADCNISAANPGSCDRADLAYWMAHFQSQQDRADAWLTDDEAESMAKSARRFLLLYQKLAAAAKVRARHLYRITPKFHCLLHMALSLPLEFRDSLYYRLTWVK
jgi:hypothetical protein